VRLLPVGSTVPKDLVIHDNERYVRYVKRRKTYNYGITKDRKIRLGEPDQTEGRTREIQESI